MVPAFAATEALYLHIMIFILSTTMLAVNLKTRRLQRGLSQEGLAKRVKVTQPYLAMLESGAFKNPTLDVLRRLAKALKCKPSELID